MNRIVLIVAMILMVNVTEVHAQQSNIDKAFLASVINDIKQSSGLPSGTAIAVIKDDQIIYQGNFGFLDIEAKTKVAPNSLFYIASTTKPFTALNFLLDAAQNKISETTTIKEMFPKLTLPEREMVTIKNLLTHTASINNLPIVLATAYSGVHTPESLQDLVLTTSTPSSEQVGKFKYTNVGYNIYSIYSDHLFQESWQSKLNRQIFDPANMVLSTALASHIKRPEHIAKPYSLTSSTKTEALYLQKSDSTMHAAGGMYATASELGRFLIAQLNAGVIDGQQIFPAEIIKISQTQQVSTDKAFLDFKRDGYAWGWYTGDYKDERMFHHFGGFAGTHAHLSFMPAKKMGLVVLNNEDFLSSRLTSIIADYVYGSLLGQTDIENTVQARAEELKIKLTGLDTSLAKQDAKIQSRQWLLSQPEKNYVGHYTHPQLGTIKIKINEENRFDVSWGVMKSSSTGMNEADKIRVTLDPTSGSVITFQVKDKVEAILYAGIKFMKE